MSHDAWDDLFAKAADVGPSQLPTSSEYSLGVEDDAKEKRPHGAGYRKRKKSKIRRRSQPAPFSNDDNAFLEMLDSRIPQSDGDSSEWPLWMHLTGNLLRRKDYDGCPGWSAEMLFHRRKWFSRCENCNASALNHRLEVSERVAESLHLRAFQYIRNLRCTASLLARKYNSTRKSSNFKCVLQGVDTWVTIKSIQDAVSDGSAGLSALKPLIWRELPESEARIVESKLNDAIHQSTLLSNSISLGKKWERRSKDRIQIYAHWDPSIRLITACDSLYYRLYYLQLVRLLPNPEFNNDVCFLPHPSDYFGLPMMTIDTDILPPDNVTKSPGDEAFPADCRPNAVDRDPDSHPLAMIHRRRWTETTMLFADSGWTASSKATELTLQSLNNFMSGEEQHETPGPAVLMDWRDGCRDFLCNLYAYSTLSSTALDLLVSFLLNGESELGVIEVGAGTGYIAKLLQNRGVHVDAWDVQPTNDQKISAASMNEYHGRTPSFLEVKKCSKLPEVDSRGRALLLCYPPPGSSMASDTLKKYLQNGGEHLIHIGEWKGLTGDQRFESLLCREFVLQYRVTCLTWGTDAASLTIWVKRDKATSCNDENMNVLLPCSHCGIREGKRRCRLLRRLVYCTADCFENDAIVRRKQFQLHCIPLDSNCLDITNQKHFAFLS